MNNTSQIDQISAYLDRQLSPSESARLEARLAADPQLAALLNDLRLARTFLRRMPARKAPRNFTLTRKMVGQRPPLPRSFFVMRFSTAFAALLLVLTFAANALTPVLRPPAALAPMPQVAASAAGELAPTEPPLMMEAMQSPADALSPVPTESPTTRQGVEESLLPPAAKKTREASPQPLIPITGQLALLFLMLVTTLSALLLRRSAYQKWK